MDCIPYINDLLIEIDTLKKINKNNNQEINDKIRQKEQLLEECKINLSKLSTHNVECRIYLKLLCGKNPTQAVKEIADENYEQGIKPTDVSTIWSNYYKKIKNIYKTLVKTK